MPGAEAKLEKRASDVARANGWWTRKFSSPSQRGVPDRVFMKNGRVVFVEFKAPDKEPSALQQRELDEITKYGGNSGWCDNMDDFKKLLGIPT